MRSENFPINFIQPLIQLMCLLCWATASADWHGDLSFRSEYVYRGYSKSRGNPVVQADLHYQAEAGWLLGSGVSQVSFDDHAYPGYSELEIKPYLGYNLALSADWRTELSVTGYFYNNKVFAHDADYAEFSAAVHYQDGLSARFFFAPDAYQRHAAVPGYELNYRRELLDNVQLSGGLGYSQATASLGQDYFYWNLGGSWFLMRNLALDIRYVDVHLADYPRTDYYQNEFYPRPLENQYLVSVTLGF